MSNRVVVWICTFFVGGCYYYEDIPRPASGVPVCVGSTLAIGAIPQASTGCEEDNGSITASASGGKLPYTFSKDGGETRQGSGVFSGLPGGTYTIIVYDFSGCSDTTQVTVKTSGSDFKGKVLSVTPDRSCLTDDGSVSFSASGGEPPYTYRLGSNSNATGHFEDLAAGTYNVTISDDASCSVNLSVTIGYENSVSYADDIAPILTAKCNFQTCHGGKSAARNFTRYETVRDNAAEIKLRTGNGDMPKSPQPGGPLSPEQIKIIACWVDAGAPNN